MAEEEGIEVAVEADLRRDEEVVAAVAVAVEIEEMMHQVDVVLTIMAAIHGSLINHKISSISQNAIKMEGGGEDPDHHPTTIRVRH